MSNINDEEKWSDLSKDITSFSKKIISRIDEEDLLDDIKNSFKNTIMNTSQLINNLIQSLEASVTNDDLKIETKEIISKVNNELKILLNNSNFNFFNIPDITTYIEEE